MPPSTGPLPAHFLQLPLGLLLLPHLLCAPQVALLQLLQPPMCPVAVSLCMNQELRISRAQGRPPLVAGAVAAVVMEAEVGAAPRRADSPPKPPLKLQLRQMPMQPLMPRNPLQLHPRWRWQLWRRTPCSRCA